MALTNLLSSMPTLLTTTPASLLVLPTLITDGYTDAISVGNTIGGGGFSTISYSFLSYSVGSTGNFPGIGDAFIGLKFNIGTELHYGWVRINISSDGNLLTIYDFAYETAANTAIIAGDTVGSPHSVPEPTSLALMATGALGILAFRRRKQEIKNA